MLLGYTATSAGDDNSFMSAEFIRKSGTSSGSLMSKSRTTMRSGGGAITFGYLDCSENSVVALCGYGYSSIAYNYTGVIIALQLR